jgi:hypothetical protein
MSLQLRRVLIALGLMAALVLTSPAPSQAADLRNVLSGHELGANIWVLIQSLWPGSGVHRLHPKSGFEKEGSGIDPNGAPYPRTMPVPVPASADEGSMIDPNGKK